MFWICFFQLLYYYRVIPGFSIYPALTAAYVSPHAWRNLSLDDDDRESWNECLELTFNEEIHMDPFPSQQSSSSSTKKGISSWFWEASSLQLPSMFCLLWSSAIWSKRVLTYFQHTIACMYTLVFQEILQIHSWQGSWMLRAQSTMWLSTFTS